jgi:hypothetical protein
MSEAVKAVEQFNKIKEDEKKKLEKTKESKKGNEFGSILDQEIEKLNKED